MRETLAVAFSIAALTGCGGAAVAGPAARGPAMTRAENTNAPAPATYTPPAPPAPTPGALSGVSPADGGGADGSGADRESPVATCGARDSYAYIAQRFRCPDGSNPLGGDLEAGRAARVGNVGPNHTGHIIDLYRVPCPGGEVEVYVDMYGCAEPEGAP